MDTHVQAGDPLDGGRWLFFMSGPRRKQLGAARRRRAIKPYEFDYFPAEACGSSLDVSQREELVPWGGDGHVL